jgi:hypothetical protein
MKRSVIAIGCVAALLGAAACGEQAVRISTRTEGPGGAGVLRVIDALTCPETVGGLTRKGSASADGAVCTYGGPRGAEVALHLVDLGDQTPHEALEQFETRLHNLMPEAAARIAPEVDAAATPETAAPAADEAADEAVAVRLPGLSIEAEGEQAEIHLPGVSISARDSGSRVAVAGVEVHSAGDGQSVRIGAGEGGVEVQSRDDVSEVRVDAGGDATRITYVLSDSRPSGSGWRSVGYHARGPHGGPIVVATVRTRDRSADNVFDDAEALVTLNVGE